MTAFLSISVDVERAMRTLSDDAARQVPFAAAKAVTALAFEVQRAERAAMSQLFDHPRPFTQRSVLVDKANKASPTAEVYVRPEAALYLAPYEFGGRQHVPGRGMATLVPVDLKLDQYGQIKGKPSTIGARPGVFVGKVETSKGPIWGFWQRVAGKRGAGQSLKLLITAGQAENTHKRLGFADRARLVVAQRSDALFKVALAQALATGKT